MRIRPLLFLPCLARFYGCSEPASSFYPVAPGSGWYELGSPNLRSAAIQVGYGNTLRIETVGNAPDKARVQSASWNGEAISDWRIAAADLVKGGTLTYTFE